VVEGLGEHGTRVADREGDELHPFPVSSKGRDRGGGYFSVFFSNLMSLSRSLYNPTSTMTRVHYFLSKEVESGEGESGTPLA
jgi:hypothetical protein